MASLNLVQFIGYLGKEPDVLKSNKTGSFVRVSLATSKSYTSEEGEHREMVEWHTVFFNNRLGNVAKEHLKKGSYVYVTGELRTTVWQDKENQKRYNTAVFASDLKLLDKKAVKTSESSGDPPKSEAMPEEAEVIQCAEYPEVV